MKIGIDELSCAIETLRRMERSAVAVAEKAASQMTLPVQLPDAWLGMAPQFAPRMCVRICMDCADKREADELALAMGWETTHTLCQKHLEKRRKEIHENTNNGSVN